MWRNTPYRIDIVDIIGQFVFDGNYFNYIVKRFRNCISCLTRLAAKQVIPITFLCRTIYFTVAVVQTQKKRILMVDYGILFSKLF